MQLKELLTEDRAVSPVIGVILMVAITVILAAVIGTFVLGLGQNVNSTPSASFNYDYNDTAVTVTHEGGNQFTEDNTARLSANDSGGAGSQEFSTPVGAGDSVTINYTNGETTRVLWVSPEGDSATISSQNNPS